MSDNDLKAQLRRILERHQGRARAITGRELAFRLEQKDDRGIRNIIRELIAEGLPVASATNSPAGFFLVASYQEAREYADSIKGRLIEDAIRRRNFRRAADCHLRPVEQGSLW